LKGCSAGCELVVDTAEKEPSKAASRLQARVSVPAGASGVCRCRRERGRARAGAGARARAREEWRARGARGARGALAHLEARSKLV